MPLADTHCHLGRYAARPAVLARTRLSGTAVLVATARPTESRDLAHVLGPRPDVEVGLGFHPEAAGSGYNEVEFAVLREIVDDFRWVSEVGLDGPIAAGVGPDFGNQPTMAAQQELFERVLAITGPTRGYSVHSRGAERLTVELLRRAGVRHAVLHCFGGDPAEMDAALDAGYHFSVHPSMLRRPELLRRLPADRLLLETDGPYERWTGRTIEPADCADLLDAVGAVRRDRTLDLGERVRDNYRALRAGLPVPGERVRIATTTDEHGNDDDH